MAMVHDHDRTDHRRGRFLVLVLVPRQCHYGQVFDGRGESRSCVENEGEPKWFRDQEMEVVSVRPSLLSQT